MWNSLLQWVVHIATSLSKYHFTVIMNMYYVWYNISHRLDYINVSQRLNTAHKSFCLVSLALILAKTDTHHILFVMYLCYFCRACNTVYVCVCVCVWLELTAIHPLALLCLDLCEGLLWIIVTYVQVRVCVHYWHDRWHYLLAWHSVLWPLNAVAFQTPVAMRVLSDRVLQITV